MAPTRLKCVQQCLKLELPDVSFDEETVIFLAGILDEEPLSAELLLERWVPYLSTYISCDDRKQAKALCERLLVSLRESASSTAAAGGCNGGRAKAPPSQPEGAGATDAGIEPELTKWLERLRLSQYGPQALAWCAEKGAAEVSEVLENWQDFVQDLALKHLEKKRVEKDALARQSGEPPPSSSRRAPPYVSPVARGAYPPGSGAMAGTPGSAGRGAVPGAGGGYQPASSSTALPPHVPRSGGKRTNFGPPEDPLKYTLLEELGVGATATVYKCCRGAPEAGGENLAVKTINLSKLRLQSDYQRAAEKLHREVNLLFSLHHPRIVSLFDVIEETDALRLVMELVEGKDLFEKIIERGTFKEAEARYVFLQIVEGLQHIHSKDIVHRDLKPENILVDERASKDGYLEVKLSDFGHSKLINTGYSTALTRVGTPQYWAPEVADPRRAAQGYDFTVDLWSLGVVLYVMLVGSYPFDGVRAPVDVQIQNADLPTGNFSGLSRDACSLIRALIRANPRDRLSLEHCRDHPWSRATGILGRVMEETLRDPPSNVDEETKFPLPDHLPGSSIEELRTDLRKWTFKYKFSASVKQKAVVVIFGDEQHAPKIHKARHEMQLIIDHYHKMCADKEPEQRVESRPRVLHVSLKVDPDKGAGLELLAEKKGMRVTHVFPAPGQPELQANDIIFRINDVRLTGTPQRVQELFGSQFGDGARLGVRRER